MPSATIAAVAGIAGAATSALGTITGGIAQGHEAAYQAQIAQNNAQIAKQNANYTLAAGNEAAQEKGQQAAEQLGRVKAAFGANNIDVNSGSAKNVEVSQRETGNLDQQNTENQALMQAYGYNTQATNFEAQSGLDQAQAAEAPIGAAVGATGSFLESASSIGFKYGGMQNGGNPFAGQSNQYNAYNPTTEEEGLG